MAEREGMPDGNDGAASGQRLGDRAYTRILETLFERKIPAGAFLSQGDLVKMLDIPVAPLRDALKLLEAEGIVIIHSRSGIQFVKPGFELTRATYQFRSILERAATGVYAQTAEEAELAELERRHLWTIEEIEPAGLAARLPRVPIFLYHGSADAIVPVAHVELYAEAIPGAHVRRLDGRDHQLNDDLADVARELRALA